MVANLVLHVSTLCGSIPSLCLVYCCTCLNSQYLPTSEFTVKLLVTHRDNFGDFAQLLNGENFPAKFSPLEVVPLLYTHRV